MLAFLLGLAAAGELPEAPKPHGPVPGQCPVEVALSPGKRPGLLDGSPLLDEDGRATCGGVLVPTSLYLDLLDSEARVRELERIYTLDTAALERDLGWERERRALLEAELAKPPAFFDRPGTREVIGEAKALLVVGAVALIVVGTAKVSAD